MISSSKTGRGPLDADHRPPSTDRRPGLSTLGALALAALTLTGCPKRESDAKNDKPSTGGKVAPPPSGLPAPVATGLPGDLSGVSRVVNPKNEKAFAGPVGTVRGVVRATGDAAIEREDIAAKISPECASSRAVHAPVFREGPGRTLADVLVTVTEYQGYVPETQSTRKLEAKDCSWGTRTIALTFGQRISIGSADSRSYVPELLGAKMKSQLVATPFGKGRAEIFPSEPGAYLLVDNLRLFMAAEVLVLKYATHDVTGLDGRFEIGNIPAGPVTVSAYLPSTGASEQKKVELKAGEPLELDFSLPFSQADYQARRAQAKPGASAGPSATPAPSAAPAPSAKP